MPRISFSEDWGAKPTPEWLLPYRPPWRLHPIGDRTTTGRWRKGKTPDTEQVAAARRKAARQYRQAARPVPQPVSLLSPTGRPRWAKGIGREQNVSILTQLGVPATITDVAKPLNPIVLANERALAIVRSLRL